MTCCGVSPFVQGSLPDGYALGGNALPSINGSARGCASATEITTGCTFGGAPHTVSVSTATTGVTVGAKSGATIPISLPSDGGSADFTIGVGGSATGWIEAADTEDFLSVSPASGSDGGMLTVSYAANPSTSSRTATITLSTIGSGTSITRTLSLTQAAALAPTLGVSRGKGGVVLYPNPVSGRLHIGGLQSSILVRISTLGGAIVRRATVSSANSSIDVSDLSRGTYVVVIEKGKAVPSKRLVIIE